MALSIDDLRSFLLVVQERSVTRAAAQLHVSQQSVSERIRRLERRIGVQLFARMPHGMQPTPAGYRLVPYAAQCIALVDQALAVIDDDDLVRLRVQRSASQAVMPFLDNLASASRIEVSMGDDAGVLLTEVADGTIDVAVGVFSPGAPVPGSGPAEPGGAPDGEGSSSFVDGASLDPHRPEEGPEGFEPARAAADIHVEGLFTDPVVWVVAPGHPLASRQDRVSLLEVSALPVSSPGPGDPASAGGVRVAARSAVAAELADGRLVEVPVDQAGWVVPISIAYRATDVDRPAVVTLRRAVTEGHALAHSRQPTPPPSGGGR